MEQKQYLQNLIPPQGKVDVVIDTDAFTEIDDLYAISYTVLHADKFCIKAICAAPFFKKPRSLSPQDGMEKSYEEVRRLLKMLGREDIPVYFGSPRFLTKETVPVESAAASFLAGLANQYSPQNPLYIIAIGAITNVASAILQNPSIKENCVIIWLGGHASHLPDGADEYNMRQDIAAARVVFSSGTPLVHLPCNGVADRFLTTKQELAYWLRGRNALCDYLYERTIADAEMDHKGQPWSRVIWDVTAAAWLLNGHHRFMKSRLMPAPIPGYDKQYAFDSQRHLICSVYHIDRDALFEDLFAVLTNGKQTE